jgi:hypothetical protein
VAYATVQELGDPDGPLGYTPSNAQLLLDRASRDVDRAIQCAVYATDGSGAATDDKVITALKEATLEQAAYQLEIGNKSGIGHGLQSGVPSGASAGEVALSRGPSTGGASADQPWLAEQAAWILRQAGLLGPGPQVGDGGSVWITVAT